MFVRDFVNWNKDVLKNINSLHYYVSDNSRYPETVNSILDFEFKSAIKVLYNAFNTEKQYFLDHISEYTVDELIKEMDLLELTRTCYKELTSYISNQTLGRSRILLKLQEMNLDSPELYLK